MTVSERAEMQAAYTWYDKRVASLTRQVKDLTEELEGHRRKERIALAEAEADYLRAQDTAAFFPTSQDF